MLHHRRVEDVCQNGEDDESDNGLDETAGHFLDDEYADDESQDGTYIKEEIIVHRMYRLYG